MPCGHTYLCNIEICTDNVIVVGRLRSDLTMQFVSPRELHSRRSSVLLRWELVGSPTDLNRPFLSVRPIRMYTTRSELTTGATFAFDGVEIDVAQIRVCLVSLHRTNSVCVHGTSSRFMSAYCTIRVRVHCCTASVDSWHFAAVRVAAFIIL